MHLALALALRLNCQVRSLQDTAQPISWDTWQPGFTRQLSISVLHLRNASWASFIILPNYFKHEFKSWRDMCRSGSSLHPSVKWGQTTNAKTSFLTTTSSSNLSRQRLQLEIKCQIYEPLGDILLHSNPLPITTHKISKKQC